MAKLGIMSLKAITIVLLILNVSKTNAANDKLKLPCHAHQLIYEHREEYVDNALPCKYFRCDNGTWIEGYRACVFNHQCYSPGRSWTYRCHQMQCVEEKPDPLQKVFRTVITSPECKFEDQCKKRDSVWRDNCITYKCDFNITDTAGGPIYRENIIAEADCKWGNKCFKDGETVTKECQTYKCYVTYGADGSVNRNMKLDQKACFGLNKKTSCIPFGEEEKFDCSTYTCKQEGNYLQMVLKEYGCKNVNGSCVYSGYKHNPTACIQQTCTKQGWATDLYACAYKGLCIPEGNHYFDENECVNRTCTVLRSGEGKKKRIIMQMLITDAGCPIKNGTCKENDEIWTDENCTKRQCKTSIAKKGDSVSSKNEIIQADCKDASGKCQPVGSTGYTAVVDGITFDNCKCSKKGRYGNTVSCSKSKEVIRN